MHFPANAGLIDELTYDRYLVDTGAILSIIPCASNTSPSGPLLKGANEVPIPSSGFITKTAQFQGKLFTSSFLQAAVAGHILGIDFLRKFRITVAPEISQIMFACMVVAQPAAKPSLPSFCQRTAGPPAPLGTTPLLPTLLARGLQVDLFHFSSQGSQFTVDPLLSVQPIPDSVHADVKLLLQKFPSTLRTGDVVPNPSHGVEHHIHTGGHPSVF
jgi:hypothetical protein